MLKKCLKIKTAAMKYHTTQLLELMKFKTMTKSNADKDVE